MPTCSRFPPGTSSRSSLKKTNLYGTVGAGTLARVPLAGGAPRQILEDVIAADWAPDGTELAVLRQVGGQLQLEYPIGKKLLTSAGGLEQPRVSPDGGSVVLVDHPENGVLVVDRAGATKHLVRADGSPSTASPGIPPERKSGSPRCRKRASRESSRP